MSEYEPFIIRLASDLNTYYKPPWWKFWQRPATQREAENAIYAALVGNVKPIRHYGIKIPVNAPRLRVFNRIMEQTGRMRNT